jgi:hypothetical protein
LMRAVRCGRARSSWRFIQPLLQSRQTTLSLVFVIEP